MQLQPIEKREGLTPKQFQEEYLRFRKPVVFKDLAASWPATQKWTFDWLKENYGQLEVPLIGNDYHTPGKYYMTAKVHKPFGEYLDMLQAGPTEYRMFLYNIFEHAPELTKDVIFPDIMKGFHKRYLFMFFGGEGAHVNLHYDIDCSSVFLTQFQTRKRLILFGPEQSRYLYQHPFTVQSHVDVGNPDYDRFPNFRKAQGYEVIINHGETIYIPSTYWHYIEYVDGGYSIALRASDSMATRVQGLWNITRHFVIDKGMNMVLGPRWKRWKEETAIRRSFA
ncbi:MAG: cupin-like domain-containing protein [Phaeodactylibacter sp.]|nr:cupin-like domain-containing protein [Phaeodactylibacter sp.]